MVFEKRKFAEQQVMKSSICHLSSVHNALDTRIFYRYCLSLKTAYNVSLIAVHPKEEWREGIHIFPFHRFKNKLLRVCFTWLIMFFKALRLKADLYHLHDPELIPCGLLLKAFGKQVVMDLHENVAEDIFDKPWIPFKKPLYWCFHFFEKLAVKRLTLVLAENSYEARYQKMGADYTTILNYCDVSFFKPFSEPVNRNTNRIFYIGILLESRGLQQISEAVYLLKQRGVEVHFDVVGELYSSLEDKLLALPYWNEVASQIHFHGCLPLEKGYEISRNAAIGMCIIQPMKNSIESYPTKMFEYMAIGLPQIISNFRLYRSVVEKHQTGLCVDPGDAAAIAAAIDTLLKQPELREQMRKQALQAAPEFDWFIEQEKLLKLYQRLLKLP